MGHCQDYYWNKVQDGGNSSPLVSRYQYRNWKLWRQWNGVNQLNEVEGW